MVKTSRGGRRAGGASSIDIATTSVNKVERTDATSDAVVGKNIMSGQDADDLRQTVDDNYDPDVVDAVKLYISDSNPNGDGFSHSQNLNYKLDQIANGKNVKLNATEKFIDDNIQAGMHDIGKSITLTRYCHDDILKALGVSNYSNMSDTQIAKQIVGSTMRTTSYSSYSYDKSKNPFRVGAPAGNGREVTLNLVTKSNTQVVFGAKKQAEFVVNKGTDLRVIGVHYDGTTAYPRSKGAMPRIVIDIEAI